MTIKKLILDRNEKKIFYLNFSKHKKIETSVYDGLLLDN